MKKYTLLRPWDKHPSQKNNNKNNKETIGFFVKWCLAAQGSKYDLKPVKRSLYKETFDALHWKKCDPPWENGH